jgi:hypothetical protein
MLANIPAIIFVKRLNSTSANTKYRQDKTVNDQAAALRKELGKLALADAGVAMINPPGF